MDEHTRSSISADTSIDTTSFSVDRTYSPDTSRVTSARLSLASTLALASLSALSAPRTLAKEVEAPQTQQSYSEDTYFDAKEPDFSLFSRKIPHSPYNPNGVLQDAELVRGPLSRNVTSLEVLTELNSPLVHYREDVFGKNMSGPEIVDHYARIHSVSPRVLLALLATQDNGLEQYDANRTYTDFQGTTMSFRRWVENMANWVNDGYYGYKYREEKALNFKDRSKLPIHIDKGSAHFAIAYYLALETYPEKIDTELVRFTNYYNHYFGYTPANLEKPLEDDTPLPPFLLPWKAGETWYYTGGPHGAWGIATAWGSLDFAPPEPVGCNPSTYEVIASAPGLVTLSQNGLVRVDRDRDGEEQTGLVMNYLHIATKDRVAVGSQLSTGDVIGHPSCEGGRADGAHVHLFPMIDGEFISADHKNYALSGWKFVLDEEEYDGFAYHPERSGNESRRYPSSGNVKNRAELDSNNEPSQQVKVDNATSVAFPFGAPKLVETEPAELQSELVMQAQNKSTEPQKSVPSFLKPPQLMPESTFEALNKPRLVPESSLATQAYENTLLLDPQNKVTAYTKEGKTLGTIQNVLTVRREAKLPRKGLLRMLGMQSSAYAVEFFINEKWVEAYVYEDDVEKSLATPK